MDSHVFSRLLEAAWENRHMPADLAAEAGVRGGSGRLGVKDLRLLLMRASSLPSAQAAVAGAWTIVSARPELAASVLHTHCQDIGDPRAFVIREVPGPDPKLFRAQAGWQQPGGHAHGAIVTRPTRKAAHQGAAVSLLGHLCGAEPVEQGSPSSGWVPAGRFSSSTPQAQARDVSFPARLKEALDRIQVAPAEVAEVVLRVNSGELIPRDLHAVLFTARSDAWQPAREAALAAAHDPAVAVAVLTLHQSLRHGPTPSYAEERRRSDPPLFRVRATCVVDGEEVSELGPWCSKKRLARGATALRLLAQLAGLPVQAPLPIQAAESRRSAPDSMLEKHKDAQEQLTMLADSGVLSELVFKSAPGVTGVEPLFVCVATCVHRGEPLTATGRALGRASARQVAARELLEGVQRAATAKRGLRLGRIPVPELGAKNPLMLLNEFKQTGKISKLSIEDETGTPTGFIARITCKVHVEWLEAVGHGANKRAAQRRAAEEMIELLATPVKEQSGQGSVPPAREPQDAVATDVHAHRSPAGSSSRRDEAATAEDSLVALLRQGLDITLDLQDGIGRFLLYRADGTPVDSTCPNPIRRCTADLVLPGRGLAVGPRPVKCWQVPMRMLANAMARTSEGDQLAPSVHLWRQAIRLGLAVVADGRVYPTLDIHGVDVWRLGPLNEMERTYARQLRQTLVPSAHCGAATDTRPYQLWAPRVAVRAGLDAVAEGMLRGPGAFAVLGNAPFTASVPRQQRSAALYQWADLAEDDRAEMVPVDMRLSVHPPKKASPDDTELLWAELLIALPAEDGQKQQVFQPVAKVAEDKTLMGHIRRRLRSIADVWAPAGRLLECPVPDRFTLLAGEAVLLLGSTRERLEQAGLSVYWPQQWSSLLRTRVLVGAAEPSVVVPRPRFSLDDVLDGRWQVSLCDADLSEQEMDDIGQAVRPLTKIRDQWVMVDEETAARAANRDLGPISSDQALRASLSGSIDIDGQDVPCEPTASLAALVDFLRTGSRTTPVPEPGALEATLRDYQQLGLAWLANTTDAGFGALLADDMGLGKTLTALALHLHRRESTTAASGPTLIVCPASVVINWEREAHRFAPTVPTLRYLGADRTLEDATSRTIVITSYETLRRDIELLALMRFDLVVADEAQTVKNHRTATARALRRVKADSRVALTGTPVENNLTEVWALMDWLNPGLFGSQRVFRDQFARPIEDNIADTERTARLSGLMSAFMLRRRKSDPGILTELPPKDIRPRIVSLTAEQIELYQRTADETFQEIRNAHGVHRKGLLLELFNKLQQICNSPAQYHKDDLEEDEYNPEQAAARSGKLSALDDLLPTLTAPEESTLIFTRYRSMARLLGRHLRSHGHTPLHYSGDIPSTRERQRIIDTFQARSGQLMIMTVKAGGTGLTLTQANHVVLFDRPWNPAKESQAIDRAHRLGQQRTVTVHPLITENTLEDRVDELLKHKRALADAVLADGYSALTELTDDQVIDLITLGAQR
ncbi:SNF2-related protein [Streptomyces sp. NBC_01789]|uniref:SNF2-related protein n=1 Tax=Streptomyces sp. NBC_01789 TaxID=2975941 RepID=UPI002252434B|nr:SNF2-related protein [Streptomyces sp. NBC_01789]MCX4451749.1 SNF2-related protein [Streptomyces sp. NBC_01789]